MAIPSERWDMATRLIGWLALVSIYLVALSPALTVFAEYPVDVAWIFWRSYPNLFLWCSTFLLISLLFAHKPVTLALDTIKEHNSALRRITIWGALFLVPLGFSASYTLFDIYQNKPAFWQIESSTLEKPYRLSGSQISEQAVKAIELSNIQAPIDLVRAIPNAYVKSGNARICNFDILGDGDQENYLEDKCF